MKNINFVFLFKKSEVFTSVLDYIKIYISKYINKSYLIIFTGFSCFFNNTNNKMCNYRKYKFLEFKLKKLC